MGRGWSGKGFEALNVPGRESEGIEIRGDKLRRLKRRGGRNGVPLTN